MANIGLHKTTEKNQKGFGGRHMLKEKLTYQETLPINCTIVEIDDYPIHFHDDLEIAFVLEGKIGMKNGYYSYNLKAGDVFIFNDREIHSFYRVGEPNIVMLLQLNLVYFNKYYDILKNNFFITDMEDEEDDSLERLRELLAIIGLEYLAKESGSERRIIESVHNLIDCLIADFQYYAMEDGKFVNASKSKGNQILAERVNRITDYLYNNYTRRLTLGEIAKREHLSIFYLSHVIKEATGLSFQDLLNFIRVEESEKLLLGTDKKIGTISMESGFSAVRYYIKYFMKWFGMHPTEYRNTYTGHVRSRETHSVMVSIPVEQLDKLLRQFTGDNIDLDMGGNSSVETIDVNPLLNPQKKSDIWSDRKNRRIRASKHLKPILEVFDILDSLKETEIAHGPHYIITKTDPGEDGTTEGYSVLLYNFGMGFLEHMESALKPEEMMNYIHTYSEKLELLFKLNGLNGEYKICRYHLTRDTFIERFRSSLETSPKAISRETLIRKWATLPVVTSDLQYAPESLFLQSKLIGFSAELILISKQQTSTILEQTYH